jgi:hypothetical protein
MGSGCGGERQGQEIVDAAVLAGTQSATPREPANSAGLRSDSNMQQRWCKRPTQRIDPRDSVCARNVGNYLRHVLPCVLSGFHSLCRRRVVSPKGTSHGSIAHRKIDSERRIREALAPGIPVHREDVVVAKRISRPVYTLDHPATSCVYGVAARNSAEQPEGSPRSPTRFAQRWNLSVVWWKNESQGSELLVRTVDRCCFTGGYHRALHRLRLVWSDHGRSKADVNRGVWLENGGFGAVTLLK